MKLCLIFLVHLIHFSNVYSKDTDPKVQQSQKCDDGSSYSFPEGFLIGCATSAYQVEGAWNIDGKGENIMDRFYHQLVMKNNDTGDIACDSYYKYKEDVKLINHVAFDHYRFSMSWSRVLPTGHDNFINQHGITYYHNLIDELIANGIQPMVTLYHWDLPQPLQDLGGWANPRMADYFLAYARVVLNEFACKVKWWITINEPRPITLGYGSHDENEPIIAPNITQNGIADYLATHTLLRAHAKVYRLYSEVYKPFCEGKMSISLEMQYYFPLTDSKEDQAASERIYDFRTGIFANPIYSQTGDYPDLVREIVDLNSKLENRLISRLPKFTGEEIEALKGSFDFFAVNHYTTFLASPGVKGANPSIGRDSGVVLSSDPSWSSPDSTGVLKTVPWGLRGLLNQIKEKYNNPPVFITENGCPLRNGLLKDRERIQFHHDYLEEMMRAIYEDYCNVIGYTVWSCIDAFEWGGGFSQNLGLFYVNFTDPARPRTKKESADYFKQMLETRKLPSVSCES